jgi:hypothetical protein
MAQRQTRLCEICADIDLVQARKFEGYPHHGCFRALRRSAASGCELCGLIVDATDFKTESDKYQTDWETDEREETRIVCYLHSSIEGRDLNYDNRPHSELSFKQKSYPFPDRFISRLRVFVDHGTSKIQWGIVQVGRLLKDIRCSHLG